MFLFKRRWILTTLLVAVAAAVMVRLGFWQLARLAGKRAYSAQVTAAQSALAAAQAGVVAAREQLVSNQALTDGTPVDCTRLGLLALTEEPVDLVISGINNGLNAGLATYVSGTVGAAREAAFQRRPAMAVSTDCRAPAETVRFFADWAVRLGERLIRYPAPEQAVCNVNVPAQPVERLREPRMCSLNRKVYDSGYERRVSPRGDVYFWVRPEIPDSKPTPDSDIDLLARGHITCTFLTPEPCSQDAYPDFLADM